MCPFSKIRLLMAIWYTLRTEVGLKRGRNAKGLFLNIFKRFTTIQYHVLERCVKKPLVFWTRLVCFVCSLVCPLVCPFAKCIADALKLVCPMDTLKKMRDIICWADWIFERSQSRFANRDSRGLGAVTYARGTITLELGTTTWRSESHACKAIEI